MNIFLIGYMGSGKSTLGQDLADTLGISWIDLDDEFELKYKIGISDFFSKYGENTFRELEHKLLKNLSLMPDLVISTGGGTPCFHGNMELMNHVGLTIYLSASPEILLSRIESSSRKRPLFLKMTDGDALQNIAHHLNTREFFYQQAKITINASKLDVLEVKALIMNHLGIISGA
jgi:shikimate kinase